MVNPVSNVLGVLAIAAGGVQLFLVWLIRNDRLPRNPLIGFRLPQLLASDEAWRVGHQAASRPMRQLAPAGIVLGLGSFLLTDPVSEVVAAVAVGVQVLAFILAIVFALRAV